MSFLTHCRRSSATFLSIPLKSYSPYSIFRAFTHGNPSANSSRLARNRRLYERVESKTFSGSSSAISIGQSVVAGSSVVGLGALVYYGLGLSSEPGALDQAIFWPEHVKIRIRDTYAYFGASLGLTAAAAVSVFRTPALLNLVSRGGWIAFAVSMAALLGSGMIVRSIPYRPGFGAKQLAWMAHAGIVGAVIAPICILGGPILTQAAWYTGGMLSALSIVAATAPSDKFLSLGGPLAMGLGVVFMASLASTFLPSTTPLGLGLYSIALYGGLVLFGGFLLYDTQKIIRRAETHPYYGHHAPYDPINNSIGIYQDTINIFIRIASILAGRDKKK